MRHIPNSSVDVKSKNRTLGESQYMHLMSAVVPVHKEAINIEWLFIAHLCNVVDERSQWIDVAALGQSDVFVNENENFR